jgi:hypothetical protein
MTPKRSARDIVLDLSALALTSDRIVLRDARGRSPRPALVPLGGPILPVGGRGRLLVPRLIVCGEFSVFQRFVVRADEGRRFAEATRDDNPIHLESDVVPGAMTAARILMLPQILFPGFTAARFRIKFRSVARYGIPTLHRFRIGPARTADTGRGPGVLDRLPRLEVRFEAVQDGQTVAEGSLRGTACSDPVLPWDRAARAAALSSDRSVSAVASSEGALSADVPHFLASLRVDGAAYLRRAGGAYPPAFLAALPSGEMVRRLEGAGGLLNALDLQFPQSPAAGAAAEHEDEPKVEVERALRPGSAFSKVLTRVVHGVSVLCCGFAMVFLASKG